MNYDIQTSITDYKNEIELSDEPIVLYFYSEDCMICTTFDPVFENMAGRYEGKVKFYKLLRQKNRELAESFDIKMSPTVVFLRNGKEVCSRVSGNIEGGLYKAALENVYGEKCNRADRNKIVSDLLILGGGPAGLSAAIYAGRAKLNTVIIDEGMTGGQVSTTYHVANYPGTNGVVRGIDLVENMKKQALSFGTHIEELSQVIDIDLEGDMKYVKGENTDFYAKAVIIATGAQPRRLPADGENEFRGRGIHYCATCDGAMYQDADLLVVGGGNSALEEAEFLTRYAKHVTIIHYKDSFRASKAAQDEINTNQQIDVQLNTSVIKAKGEHFLESVELQDTNTNEIKERKTDGVFVYIGMEPKTKLFSGKINLDDYGYILTDEEMRTNVKGVFAAGDVRQKSVRQIATATSDGVIAGIMAERYINGKGN